MEPRAESADITHLQTSSWHPADIKAALEKRGVRLKDLAREMGVSPSMISLAIRGGGYSSRLRDHIASRIQQSPLIIWPHLYAQLGSDLNREAATSIQPKA